eukprot:14796305-Heterocapsa_arctica.AAC.1
MVAGTFTRYVLNDVGVGEAVDPGVERAVSFPQHGIGVDVQVVGVNGKDFSVPPSGDSVEGGVAE